MERNRAVTGLVLGVLLLTAVVLPQAGTVLGPHPSFLPAFFAAVLLLDLLSGWLLLMQYRAGGRPRLLLLSLGYAWCVASVVPHALVFPGVVAEAGLLGAEPSSAPWLWTTWHAGFAVALAAAAAPVAALDRPRPERGRTRDVLGGLAAVAVLGSGAAWLATSGAERLPTILAADDYGHLSRTAGPWIVALSVVALALALRHSRRSAGLDQWFAVVAASTFGDVVLTIWAQARFTTGWYAARALALTAAGVVLLALVGQMTRLYRRLEASSAQLRQLADTDDLTGLPNRRAVLQTGHRLAAEGRGLAVALVDVDHFKSVNDTLGHDAGDQVLFTVAGRLDGALRTEDVVGRYGGEEFLALLPGCTAEEAEAACERARVAVARRVATSAGVVLPTVSVGVAVVGDDLLTAIAAADVALYRAKAGGRDRVERAGGLPVQRRAADPARA